MGADLCAEETWEYVAPNIGCAFKWKAIYKGTVKGMIVRST
jgi:hypothetical protein